MLHVVLSDNGCETDLSYSGRPNAGRPKGIILAEWTVRLHQFSAQRWPFPGKGPEVRFWHGGLPLARRTLRVGTVQSCLHEEWVIGQFAGPNGTAASTRQSAPLRSRHY